MQRYFAYVCCVLVVGALTRLRRGERDSSTSVLVVVLVTMVLVPSTRPQRDPGEELHPPRTPMANANPQYPYAVGNSEPRLHVQNDARIPGG